MHLRVFSMVVFRYFFTRFQDRYFRLVEGFEGWVFRFFLSLGLVGFGSISVWAGGSFMGLGLQCWFGVGVNIFVRGLSLGSLCVIEGHGFTSELNEFLWCFGIGDGVYKVMKCVKGQGT